MPPASPMTAEEFVAWVGRPENVDRLFELDAGEVRERPLPGERHGLASWLVIKALTDCVTRHGSGYLLTNHAGILLGRNPDTVLTPDVMVFPGDPVTRGMSGTYVEDVPDLVVEVVIPTERRKPIGRAVDHYLARGVPLVWLVYPLAGLVTVHSPGRPSQVLGAIDELTGSVAPPDFACPVRALFALPPAP